MSDLAPLAMRMSAIFLLLGIVRLLLNRYSQLSRIPGPWLASCTNLWRFALTWTEKAEATHIKLHAQHGDVVRLGPNLVSVTDLHAVKKIYGAGTSFEKSEFYATFRDVARGHILENMFSLRNNGFHKVLRRSVASAFSMSTLVQLEPFIDSTLDTFMRELNKRFVNPETGPIVFDFSRWLNLFAFDAIGELSFSERIGFLESGGDMEGIMHQVEMQLGHQNTVGQMPWLDGLWAKNPIKLWLGRMGILQERDSIVVRFAARKIKERYEALGSGTSPCTTDFLDRFLQAGLKDPELMTQQEILSLTLVNIFAGGDTTAIALSAIFYFLLKNPSTLEKLMVELSASQCNTDSGIMSYNEARKLPYLKAVIQEGLRMFPGIGNPLERVVPPQGLEVCGHFLPGGTVVGTSAWPLHAKESIFGANPRDFRPERWIEASESQRSLMNSAMFAFGMGNRSCIGQNISLLEIHKVVPTILWKYELALANPTAEWTTSNRWFIYQKNFFVTLKHRVKTEKQSCR